MGYRILLCGGNVMNDAQCRMLESMVRQGCRGEISRLDLIRSSREFREMVDMDVEMSGYNLIFVVDSLSGNEYVDYIPANVNNKSKYIVICPGGSIGSESIKNKLLMKGLFNGIYFEDIGNVAVLSKLIEYPRNADEAVVYYALNNAVVRYGQNVDNPYVPAEVLRQYEEPRKHEYVPQTRQLIKDGVKIADIKRTITSCEIKEKGVADSIDAEILDMLDMDEVEIDEEVLEEYKFNLDPEYVKEGVEALKEYFQSDGLSTWQAFKFGNMERERFLHECNKVLSKIYKDREEIEVTRGSYLRDVESYGKVDVAIDDEDVSDIRLHDKDTVLIMAKGQWYKSNISFDSNDDYEAFINGVCAKNNKALNIAIANLVFGDTKSHELYTLRFAVSGKTISKVELPSLHIRKINKVKKTTAKLIEEGLWTQAQASFLRKMVAGGASIILVGATGSGKTVLANNLIDCVSPAKLGLVVQESDELFSKDGRNNIEFQHCIDNLGESKVKHDLKELATQGLVKSINFFCIGEVKSTEAEAILTTASVGNQFMTTTHANNAFEGLTRIADLAGNHATFKGQSLIEILTRGKPFIVYLEKYKIKEVLRAVNYNKEFNEVEYDMYDFV